MESPSSKKGLSYGIVIAIIAIAVIAAVVKYSFKKTDETASVTESAPAETTLPTTGQNGSTESSGTASSATYKDGTYSATGSYVSPGGQESLSVTLTLNDDVVTDATVVSKANNPQSREYQNRFISGYKTYVIGKNISSIKLDKVSGSSLSPKGFNDAVAKIETQAKA